MSILLLKNKQKWPWPLNTILVREWKDDDIDFFEFNEAFLLSFFLPS
mgnify:CR=1 FL=1